MPAYRLYCFGESGNSYKVALYLALCGADWSPVIVDFFNGETRSQVYRDRINAMGEVPVLAADGHHWSQSGVILTLLSERFGQFGPSNEADRLDVLRWLLFDNHKFTSYIATLRFMVAFARTGENAVTAFLRQRVETSLALVDSQLAERPFLVGEAPTIADLSLAGYVFYPEEYGIDFGAYVHFERWRQRLSALPGFVGPYELMPRAPAKRRQ
jgi:glutathione S-transferase